MCTVLSVWWLESLSNWQLLTWCGNMSPTLSIGSLYKSVVMKLWVVKHLDSILSLCSPFRPVAHHSLKLPDRTAEEILRKQMFSKEVGRTGYHANSFPLRGWEFLDGAAYRILITFSFLEVGRVGCLYSYSFLALRVPLQDCQANIWKLTLRFWP